jgi:RNA polymerase sigma-70 factor (family 1)
MVAHAYPLTDFELTDLIKADDEQAFRIVYERYWDKIFAVAQNRLKNSTLAEEIVQDIFCNFWSRRKTLHLEKALDNYFAIAVKFELINHLARAAKASAYEKELSSALSIVDESTLHQLDYRELQRQFRFTVNSLPEKCRTVFMLQQEAGYSHQQIADELNISTKTVEAHLSKARRTLKSVFGNLLGLLL